MLLRPLIGVVHDLARSQPISAPITTMVRVSHFNVGGRMYGAVDIGSIHWIAAPPIMDAPDIITIGEIIFHSSVIEANGEWLQGPQITAIEKRRE